MKLLSLKNILAAFTLMIALTAFSPAPSGLVDEVLDETNALRKTNGLPVLVLNDELNFIAQQHSNNMAKGIITFGHAGFEKRNSEAIKRLKTIKGFAENVAFGPTSGKAVVQMWKNSAGHKQNLLGKYTLIGIGVATDDKGNIFYTQVFAG